MCFIMRQLPQNNTLENWWSQILIGSVKGTRTPMYPLRFQLVRSESRYNTIIARSIQWLGKESKPKDCEYFLFQRDSMREDRSFLKMCVNKHTWIFFCHLNFWFGRSKEVPIIRGFDFFDEFCDSWRHRESMSRIREVSTVFMYYVW